MEGNISLEGSAGMAAKAASGMTRLTPEDLAKVQEIKNQINLEDAQAIITYGVGAQREVSAFSDSILKEVRNKDSGYVGGILGDLIMKINQVDVSSIGKESFWAKIPLLGNLVSSVKRFITRYEKLSTQIEHITRELDTARIRMLRDITLLDTLYSRNLTYMKHLELYIEAGTQKLDELRATMLPELKAKAEKTGAPADVQRYNDFQQFLNRFEQKIHDLKLSRLVSVQAAPQIRMIQHGDQALVEKIQSSILNTIPLWKNQMAVAITMLRQKKALEMQKEVTRTTNELLRKNSKMLRESTVGIVKESERGIVDIETLKKVNADLLATIQETLRIQSEGKAKRDHAENELTRIEAELKGKLMELRKEMTGNS
jgi:uncharacterized protein YaaN involved in tellurite resistance